MSRRERRQALATPRRVTLPAVILLTDRELLTGETIEVVVTARVVGLRVQEGSREGRFELEAIEAEVRWGAPAC